MKGVGHLKPLLDKDCYRLDNSLATYTIDRLN